MKFDLDYDEILKNGISKTKNNEGEGAIKKRFFSAISDRKFFFMKKTKYFVPILSCISLVCIPCSEARMQHKQNPGSPNAVSNLVLNFFMQLKTSHCFDIFFINSDLKII
jgi:hypothetical protein